MYAALTVSRYPGWLMPAAILSMAWFRLPLWLDKRNLHYKLMGSGRNGSFDMTPDLRQWAVMVFRDEPFPASTETSHTMPGEAQIYGRPISGWWRFFGCETWTVLLRVRGGHGTWDGKSLANNIKDAGPTEGPIAVMTRATIRWKRLRAFWSQVAPVSKTFFQSPGLILSLGIGEAPLTRQATFSIWRSETEMKSFAYKSTEHKEVIARTRKEQWYSEDMFLRFEVLNSLGTIRGNDPWKTSLNNRDTLDI